MYRDVAQWSSVRDRILRKGASIRQVVRETGISRKTVRKMLDHPLPQPYGPRSRRHPKLGPHVASVRRMLQENATLPPSARLATRAIYERIRDDEGFSGSYASVRRFARRTAIGTDAMKEHAGKPLAPQEGSWAVAGRGTARQAAFEWMRAVLQKDIRPD